MSIVGRTYLERGEPVEVLAQWRAKSGQPFDGVPPSGWCINLTFWTERQPKAGPRNVLIRRVNGDLVVRPFRGLRKAGTA